MDSTISSHAGLQRHVPTGGVHEELQIFQQFNQNSQVYLEDDKRQERHLKWKTRKGHFRVETPMRPGVGGQIPHCRVVWSPELHLYHSAFALWQGLAASKVFGPQTEHGETMQQDMAWLCHGRAVLRGACCRLTGARSRDRVSLLFHNFCCFGVCVFLLVVWAGLVGSLVGLIVFGKLGTS